MKMKYFWASPRCFLKILHFLRSLSRKMNLKGMELFFSISRWSIWPFLSLTEQKSCQIYMKSTLRGHLLLGNWVIRLNQQDGILCKRKTIKSRLFDRFKTQRIKKMRIFQGWNIWGKFYMNLLIDDIEI